MPVNPAVESLRRDIAEIQSTVAVLDDRSKNNVSVIEKLREEHEEELNKIIVDYKDQVSKLKSEIVEVKKELDSVYTTVQRARGGFIALVALGSVIGWLLTQLQAIQGLLGKGH